SELNGKWLLPGLCQVGNLPLQYWKLWRRECPAFKSSPKFYLILIVDFNPVPGRVLDVHLPDAVGSYIYGVCHAFGIGEGYAVGFHPFNKIIQVRHAKTKVVASFEHQFFLQSFNQMQGDPLSQAVPKMWAIFKRLLSFFQAQNVRIKVPGFFQVFYIISDMVEFCLAKGTAHGYEYRTK